MTPSNEHILSPGEFLAFLDIDLQRLRVWVEAGLLGEEHRSTGRGYSRRFSRKDVIVGRVIREIMDLTRSRSFAIAQKDLLIEAARSLRWGLGFEGAVLSSSTGKLDPTHWLIISWDRDKKDWHMTHAIGGGSAFPGIHAGGERPPRQALILIPLWELIEEVDQFLAKREMKP